MSEKSSRVRSVVQLGLVASLVAAVVVAYNVVKPRGEPVGEVDVLARRALEVDLRAGDALTFPAQVTTGTDNFSGTHKQRASEAVQAMGGSLLMVSATSPAGKEVSSTCQLWKGSMDSSWQGEDLTQTDVYNECEIRIPAAGHWKIEGTINWNPSLQIRAAKVAVRREGAEGP